MPTHWSIMPDGPTFMLDRLTLKMVLLGVLRYINNCLPFVTAKHLSSSFTGITIHYHFSVILLHSALSLHRFFHRLIPIICIFSSISTTHLFLGLPLVLVPIGFYSNILLGILLSSIRITWPSQAILLLYINFTMSVFSISSFSS
jgi:hypothetical protein